jgi:phage/plasmid primase-like uncharacterized protein
MGADLRMIFGAAGFDSTKYDAPAQDAVAEFLQYLSVHDLSPGSIKPDGQLHRFADGPKDHGKSGWYVFHADGIPAGAAGSWRRDISLTWSHRNGVGYSPEEIERNNLRMAQHRAAALAERQQSWEQAAETAARFIAGCQPADAAHPYLAKKRVGVHGVLQAADGRIIVPRVDACGRVWSWQGIDADGGKRYMPGGRAKGTFHVIGGPVGSLIYVAEGYATAATVHEATGKPVAVAFDAGNLKDVATSLRAAHPGAAIVIAGDVDESGVGQKAAHEAAVAVAGRVLLPVFAAPGADCTDWNDLAVAEGLHVVKRQMDAAQPRPLLIGLSDMLAEARAPEWTVRGVEERNTIGVTFGEPGAAKSFFELSKSLAIAHGMPWVGRKTTRGVVVYVAGEGQGGLAKRIMAWHLHHGIETAPALFWATRHRVTMMVPEEASSLRVAISALAEKHGRIDKIVIDTLARNMGGDENSTADMSAFIDAVDMHLRVPFGAAVTIVHHTGWAALDRMRGSRALEAASDTACSVARDAAGIVTVESKRMKDGEPFDPMYFRLQSVPLPGMLDDEGNPLSSAVLISTESPDDVMAGLRPQDRRALEWLRGEFLRIGMTLKEQGRDPASASVEWRGWKEATHKAGIWTGDRAVFSRIGERLEAAGLVARDGVFVKLTNS